MVVLSYRLQNGQPSRVGLEGAALSTNLDDASTAGVSEANDEARGSRERSSLVITKDAVRLSNDSESRESRAQGLPKSAPLLP